MANEVLQYPTYMPAVRGIIAVTNATHALVTTGTLSFPANILTATPMDHSYVTGQMIRLWIPWGFGMVQLSQKVPPSFYSRLTVINTTQFTLDLDTTLYDPFILPIPTYGVSPVTGYPVVTAPYRMWYVNPDDPMSPFQIDLSQIAQCIPHGLRADVLTGELKNVLPYNPYP